MAAPRAEHELNAREDDKGGTGDGERPRRAPQMQGALSGEGGTLLKRVAVGGEATKAAWVAGNSSVACCACG
jgi:hypothetical protein